MEQENNVRVAVRIRPQLPKEVIDMCKTCTRVTPGEPQVWLGADKAFTYDHVFDSVSNQSSIYEDCVKKLIDGCFEGFNATVLAYGQTGSGKTYTMGTGFDIGSGNHEKGIIPRAVEHLFNGILERQREARDRREPIPEFKVSAQFLELYNEDIIDLLSDERSKHSQIKIHEDSNGGIYINGVTTKPVQNMEESLQCLKMGALSRTTASTQMNAQSSRSHAIFTLHVKQHRVTPIDESFGEEISEQMNTDLGPQEFETLTAKFHFVDLAGSERLKRTGATGERAREGISINSGLLALGNVISALGDKAKRATHVPYRDSKLTRLLQDSLGGNSMTLMIACVSPSDRDFMETLNTLRYANRAKNIKNRVTANQDKSSQTITALRREIQQLQIELQEYKQGKRLIDSDGTEKINDMFHENNMLLNEMSNLRTRVKALQETNERLTARNTDLLVERESGVWINSGANSDISTLVKGYMKEIEELRTKLMEMEETCSLLRKQNTRMVPRHSMSPFHASGAVAMTGNFDIHPSEEMDANDVLIEAKKEMKKLTKVRKNLLRKDSVSDTNGNDIEVNEATNDINGDEEQEQSEDDTEESEENSEETDNGEEEAQNAVNAAENELMALTSDISMKEKLIEQLEKTQKRMNSMRQHYEDKLMQLQNKISETESERDNVLTKLNSLGSQGDDKARKVREEYQKKLNNLQTEMKKLQMAKREHSQAMRAHSAAENQMRNLRNEVMEMKKQKVKLVAKMKEEMQKHREAEIRNNKKISQLSKQDRQKEIKIRSLEVESNRYKNLLKRKDEEIKSFKRRVNPMSDKVAGRIVNGRNNGRIPLQCSPVSAKLKWQKLEMDINKIVLSKQNISVHEKAMERYLHQRQQLSRTLDRTNKKYESAIKAGKEDNELRILQEEIDTIEANLKYINENIDEMQSTIVQIEDAKDIDVNDMSQIIPFLKPEEVKYLFDKVLTMAIHQSMLATQKEEEKKEIELQYKQVTDSSLIQEQLLHHVLDQTYIDGPVLQSANDENGYEAELPPLDFEHQFAIPAIPPQSTRTSTPSKEKARRTTRTPQELLFDTSTVMENKNNFNDAMTQSLIAPNIETTESDLHRVPSAPSLKDCLYFAPKSELFYSPSFKRKTYERLPLLSDPTRRLRTATLSSSGNSISNQPLTYVSRQLSTEFNSESSTPPVSPSVQRRNRDATENVFSRLTNGSITNNQFNIDRTGSIVPFSGKCDKSAPLVCTHIAEGHTRAVLSVVATNDVLFSGSKDCSLKIWDLQTGQQIQSICDHPDSVQVVRYNEYNRLAFSASKSYIKVWDPRDSPARCVKTLNSSGLVSQNNISMNLNTTKLELAPGEANILDVQLSTYGTTLFSTCSRIVRVWDLRMFHCIGKLNTGHKADIMCLAVEEAGVDNNLVITGSKDHYIKIFEMMEGVGGIHNPKMCLKPPHYDGIEALKISGDFLFSGSRDACIKKWDLQSQRLVQSLNNCHKDWVLSLNTMPNSNTLISGCRSGQMKLWSTENSCQLVGDIKAHSGAINSIDTNSSLVFTASSDNTINLWRWRSNTDPSPDYIDE